MQGEYIEFIDEFIYIGLFILALPFLIYFAIKRSKDKDKEQFENRDH